MKYVSLDLETTGLDTRNHQIMGVAMVIEDTNDIKPLKELPAFICLVNRHTFSGSAYALNMNSWILEEVNEKNPMYPVYTHNDWEAQALAFLNKHFGETRAVLAGKNVASFDYQFLSPTMQRRFIHRMIDPGSVFIDWTKEKPLDLGSIKERVGLEVEVTHDMYYDALDVIRVLRTQYAPFAVDY